MDIVKRNKTGRRHSKIADLDMLHRMKEENSDSDLVERSSKKTKKDKMKKGDDTDTDFPSPANGRKRKNLGNQDICDGDLVKRSSKKKRIDDTEQTTDTDFRSPANAKKKKSLGNQDICGKKSKLSLDCSQIKKKKLLQSNFEDTSNGESTSDELVTPKRKRVKTTAFHIQNNDEDLEYGQEPIMGKWSKEETMNFLEIMKEHTKSESSKTCAKEINSIKWDEVIQKLESNKTNEQCEQMFRKLMSAVLSRRNLHEIICACQRILPDLNEEYEQEVVVKPIVNARILFASRHHDEIMDIVRKDKINYFVASKQAYADCSVEELKAIEEEVEYQRQETKNEKRLPTHTPVMIYYFKNKEKFQEDSHPIVLARKKYDGLSASKKLKYIKKAMEELESYLSNNPDIKLEVSLIKLNKQETGRYLTEILNIPTLPQKSGRLLYHKRNPQMQEFGSDTELLAYMKKMWDDLPVEKKKIWNTKANKKKEKYKEDLRVWKDEQTPVSQLLVDKLYGAFEDKLSGICKISKSTLHSVEMPLSRMKFFDEPKLPSSMSALHCYAEKQRLKGKNIENVKEEYPALDISEKQKYKQKSLELKDIYADIFLKYVHRLDARILPLYLGFRRTGLITVFRRDIFEADFPSSKYPVFSHKKTLPKSNEDICNDTMMEDLQKSFGGTETPQDEDDDLESSTTSHPRTKNKKNFPNVRMAAHLESPNSDFSSSD